MRENIRVTNNVIFNLVSTIRFRIEFFSCDLRSLPFYMSYIPTKTPHRFQQLFPSLEQTFSLLEYELHTT